MIRSFKDGAKEDLAAGRSPKRECGEREAYAFRPWSAERAEPDG
jgi:hypothetical protein